MPSSNLAVAPAVIHLVNLAITDLELGRPATVLDVGPGRGKYGYLLREYVDPELTIDAIEAWPPYIEDFGLEHIYRTVTAGDILDEDPATLAAYDVVLMADVIEHIDKAAALELLTRIPGAIVISTPRDFFDNPSHLPHTEKHISHWTVDDFKANPRFRDYSVPALRNLGGVIVWLGPA